MITGKNLLDCELKISTDGVNYQKLETGADNITITTSSYKNDDAVDSLWCYLKNDLDTTKQYQKYTLGIWDKKEEEKDMNNLLNIYVEKAKKDIEERKQKEIDKYKSSNVIVTTFNELVEEFEKQLDELYEAQEVVDEVFGNDTKALIKSFTNENLYKYKINAELINTECCEITKKYNKELNELEELVNEINGHLSMLRTCEEDSYEKMLTILKQYNIVDTNGKLNSYKHVEEEQKTCDECSCEKQKRGRKPKKEQA